MQINPKKYNQSAAHYDELLKRRNEIMKQCMNQRDKLNVYLQNSMSSNLNQSYESGRNSDGFQRSQYLPQQRNSSAVSDL